MNLLSLMLTGHPALLLRDLWLPGNFLDRSPQPQDPYSSLFCFVLALGGKIKHRDNLSQPLI